MFPNRQKRDRIEKFVEIVGKLRNAIVGSTVDDAPPIGSEREPSPVNQLIIWQYDRYSVTSSQLICCADFSDLLQSRNFFILDEFEIAIVNIDKMCATFFV